MKTLEQQFGTPNLNEFKAQSEGLQECEQMNNQKLLNIIHHIVKYECQLEHRQNLNDDHWEKGTLREFLSSAILVGYKEKYPKVNSWAFNFWRIKTKPTAEELSQLVKAKPNED